MDDDVTIEGFGQPTGRLPKELFGVCLSYRIDTYPNWEKPKTGKTRTAHKNAKKRHYFLFTKRSSQQKMLDRLTQYVDLDEHTVEALHGRIEWESVEKVEVTE